MFIVKYSMVFDDEVFFKEFKTLKDVEEFIMGMWDKYNQAFDYNLYIDFHTISYEEVERLEKMGIC